MPITFDLLVSAESTCQTGLSALGKPAPGERLIRLLADHVRLRGLNAIH